MAEVDIGSFTKSVVDIWQFISTPIWLLFFVLAISAFINRIKMAFLINELNSHIKQLFSVVIKEGTAEKANWFYTIISIFIFLSCLYIIEVSSSFVGNLLPPNLSYRNDALFAWHNDDTQIRTLGLQYPQVSSVEALILVIESRISELSKDNDNLTLDIKYWEESAGNFNLRLDRLKFLSLIALLSFFVGRKFRPTLKPSLLRLLVIVIVLTLIGTYCSAMYFYSVEQQQFAKNRYLFLKDFGNSDHKSIETGSEITLNLINLFEDYYRLKNTRWYEARIVDTDFPKWFYRTFFERPYDHTKLPEDIRDAAEKRHKCVI
jgi:hypothetical protein